MQMRRLARRSGRSRHIMVAALGAAVLVGTLAIGPSAALATEAAEVEACIRDNFPATTSVQTVRFQTSDRTGDGRLIEGKIWWKHFDNGLNRALYRVLSPPDLRGSAVLVIERKDAADLFTYLPELKKVRRITSHTLHGSLFGSDFTYEDFLYLQGVRSGTSSVENGAKGSDWTVTTLPAASQESAYEQIVAQVDQATCLPLRTEFYEAGGRLRKVMTIDPEQVHEEDGARIPLAVEMADQLQESRTELTILEIDVGSPIKRRVFEVNSLEKSNLD
jgi:hypothetical protein